MSEGMVAGRQGMATEGARFVAVASGKGGVGKTWFTLTLAHALARAGRRVLVFDGDFGLANVDVQLGLVPPLDLADVLGGRATWEEAIVAAPGGGFDVLPGRSGSGALAALGRDGLAQVRALLAALGPAYDHVIMDLGAGLEAGVRELAAWADLLLVVATDEPTSVTDAYATLKLHRLNGAAGEARLVVNQAASAMAAERTATTIRRACAAFLGWEPALLGGVRRDARVADAIRRQTLLLTRHPTTAAAADVEAIARCL